jgi:hypothetical protein
MTIATAATPRRASAYRMQRARRVFDMRHELAITI